MPALSLEKLGLRMNDRMEETGFDGGGAEPREKGNAGVCVVRDPFGLEEGE
jgi:hypothetical protein